MSKVFITGATGFVGGALARALVTRGHDVVALARLSSRKESLADLDIKWVAGDVTDAASLHGAFDGIDWLIHAAGMLGQVGVPEAAYHALHEGGTNNVLAEAERAGVVRIMYVSSPGVLGPIVGEPANETAPLAPSNAYERSKAAAEQAVAVYARAGLPVTIARPEFIYGPTDLHVFGLFTAVKNGRFFTINKGRHTCHPTYIDDAVDGMLRVLKKGSFGEIYHIAGPNPVTFKELGETIAAALDVPPPKFDLPRWLAMAGAMGLEVIGRIVRRQPPLSRDGVAFFSEDRRFSCRKAHDELGYTPQFDLQSGVEKTVAWYWKID